MDQAQLLSDFQAQIDEFEKLQGFIEKAEAQADRFAPDVVARVIQGHTDKRDQVVETIMIHHLSEVEQVIEGLRGDRQSVLDGQGEAQAALSELELRLAIGEFDEDEFEKQAADLKAQVGEVQEKVAAIDGELETWQGALERWQGLGEEAGVLRPEAEEPEPEPEPEPQPEPEPEEVEVEDVELEAFQDHEADIAGVHADVSGGSVEDLQVTLDSAEVEEEEEGFGFALEGDDLDLLSDDAALELDLDGAGDGETSKPEGPRRAVLLYQEGTAEEQIYPFTGEQLSLGRGRENDIQIKNDSKVSRYHCKLFRRGPNFYIEDNKSANGTLVNGELITERRLFGGEEVIIGETFFRFRIMD